LNRPAVITLARRLGVALIGLTLVVAALGVALRFTVRAPPVLSLIDARIDGMKVGRFGRLEVDGISGDPWRDMRIRRVALRDADGVWIEAINVHMTWRYADLLRRNFHAERIVAERLTVKHRPKLGPRGPRRPMPVSVRIDHASALTVLEPAFSYRRGVYDLALTLDFPREGDRAGTLKATSRMHAGDRLDAAFHLGADRRFRVRADAVEARGGALAGALGLAIEEPFRLRVAADGQGSTGKFQAFALSGGVAPLRADGAWTPQGGNARGYIDFEASRLTLPMAARLGRRAEVVVSGRGARDGFYALSGRATAENFSLTAAGSANYGTGRVGPDGLRFQLDIPSVERLTPALPAGAARIAGALNGRRRDWRFDGTASLAALTLGGYELPGLAGPIALIGRRDEIDLKADITGAGGRGRGWLAALLGAQPKLSMTAARMTDGRLLVRDALITGRGLKLTAAGERNLLGGLTVKGQADFANLAEARAGAGGAVRATWSAGQPARERPWTFTVDARGERFATGYGELDRLFGAQPRLRGEAGLTEGVLTLTSAALEGAAISAKGRGVLAGGQGLALGFDWQASGPFRAGPVEISGEARGQGQATGPLGSLRLGMTAGLQTIDLPRLPLSDAKLTLEFQRRADGADGMIAVAAQSEHGPARASAAMNFVPGGVELTKVSVDAGGLQASGEVSLRRRAASTADLRLAIGPGAFIETGGISGDLRIIDAAGGPRANLNLRGEGVRMSGAAVTLRALRITAEGPTERLPYTVKADGASSRGAWSLDGGGHAAWTAARSEFSFEGAGALGPRRLRTLEPATMLICGRERTSHVRLEALGGGQVRFDETLTSQTTAIRGEIIGLGLEILDEDLAGQFDATFDVNGRGDVLEGVLDAKLVGARARGAAAESGLEGVVTGRLARDRLSLELQASNRQGLRANANVELPTESTAAPLRIAIARMRPLSGRFFAEGEVSPLWALLIGGERSLSGRVRTEVTLGGTLADPTMLGQIAVDGGRFDDGSTGLSLRDVTLRADLRQDVIDVSQAVGTDGRGGAVNGAGRISLQRAGVSSFQMDLKNFRLVDNDRATASASGRATIDRAADGRVRIAGKLIVDRADIAADLPTPSGVVAMEVREINQPDTANTRPLVAARRRTTGWTLDVDLDAPRHVFLRGRGLDVEFSLDAHVGGTTSRPDLSGVARVVRGDYDFSGKRFTFETQGAVTLSTRVDGVRLDLTARREDPTLIAVVRVRGVASKPEVTLTSQPSLPTDEVLSRVLFGRSAAQLSPLEAAQLAASLSALASGGDFDPIGNLRGLARLDRLALGGGDETGMTVSGGKYLTDDVYLELTGGGREGTVAEVEWRVRRNLSVLSRIVGQTGARLAVRWRRDY
jgi:translocation and assembly module TamB